MTVEKNILCFGDSNTYGESPEGLGRYPRQERWTGILAQRLGPDYHIIEEGLCGRTTVWEDPVEGDKCGIRHLPSCIASHTPLDLVILMLGTNDFKQRFQVTASEVAISLDRLVRTAQSITNGVSPKPFEILLACPAPLRPQTCLGEIIGDRSADSAALPPLVQDVANRCGVHFINVGAFAEASLLDGLHYDRENHIRIAEAMEAKIREILG